MNGSASSDANGTIVGYEWREGEHVSLRPVHHLLSALAVGTTSVDAPSDRQRRGNRDRHVVVTVNPRPAPTGTHVGDLDGSATGNKSAWTARITVDRSQYGSPGRHRRRS